MATYKEIKAHVKTKYGFVPQDCWIAHAKSIRRGIDGNIDERVDIGTATKPCSEQKRAALFTALQELGMFK